MKQNTVTFRPENLLIQQTVPDKEKLIQLLAEKAGALPELQETGMDAKKIFSVLMHRESEFSTALGGGIIFPHARVSTLHSNAVVLLATLKTPMECDTPDKQPVRIACMMLIPQEQPMQGLKLIASLAKSLKETDFSEELYRADSAENAMKLLAQIEWEDHETLTAADIMTPFRCNATPEMHLKDATRMMARFNADTVPVLENGKLTGQLSCRELFTLGIPDFFSQLKSVGFIRYFDPFEKYFAVEASSLVRDVMSRNYVKFTPEATLIEIVFAISVQHQPQVYIVNAANDLLGVIDQALLLERVINL